MTWLLPLSGLTVAAMHYILLHYIYHIHVDAALADSVISTSLLSLALWGVAQGIKIYPTRVGVTLYSLLTAIFFSLSTVFLSTYILKWWVSAEQATYLNFLDNSGPARYIIYWLLCSSAATYIALTKRITTLEARFKKQTDSAVLLKEAELFKLRQQLQPHFLYNSLNSISALTIIEPEKAQQMIGLLSDFLRNSVQREAKEKIPLEDELSYLQNYLAIEAIRFGDRLNVVFNNTISGNFSLPPFLLQPLIENAIKFGLYGTSGNVTISVDIAIKNGMLVIIITNPYSADADNTPRGTGFGLEGVNRRLFLVYARTDLLDTRKKEDHFITTIKIPQDNA